MTTEPNASAGQEPTPASTPGQEPTASTTPQAGKSSDDYEKMLAELRKENAMHRTKLKSFEEQEAARQLAALSDAEKTQKQLEQAKQQLQNYKDELVKARVRENAIQKGIIDPEIAALALNGKLEYDDDGMPSNLDQALDALIKSKPYLVPKSGEPAPANAAQTAPSVPSMNPGRSTLAQQGTLPAGRLTFQDIPWKS